MANRQVIVKSRPVGIPQAEHFTIVDSPIPSIEDGEVLVRNAFLSVDPAMRGWLNVGANYMEPVEIGAVMRAFTVGTIVESRHPDHPVGSRVLGLFGWQEFAAVSASAIQRVIPPESTSMSAWLGVLGLTGMTAYFGLHRIGEPQAGDTVVVSTAAGSVGSAVGQLARLAGCRTVGITRGARKMQLCREQFGFDATVDYTSPHFLDDLARACADGVNVYFDNTAGPISDAVHAHLALGARLVICGTASVANWDPPPLGPRIERTMLAKRARMQGLLVFDYAPEFPEAEAHLMDLIARGDLVYREEILEGIEQAPDAIAGLYRGENEGKRVIRLP